VSENITQQSLLDADDGSHSFDEAPFLPETVSETEFHAVLRQDQIDRQQRFQMADRANKRKERKRQAISDKADEERNLIQESPFAFHLFDVADVESRVDTLNNERNNSACMNALREMRASGGYVLLVPQPADYEVILDELKLDYPHFDIVIEFIRNRMRLNALKATASLTFGSNILLDGPVGLGKTSFVMALTEKMNTVAYSFSCASATNSFCLTGLSGGYNTGRPGKLHELLATKKCPNPIILLDEIEKASDYEKGYSITGALYELLEKNNARAFRDEFIDVQIDASRVCWFATSNQASRLDIAIRDRFNVLPVRQPTRHDLRLIIPRLYQRMIVEMDMEGIFEEHLSEHVLDFLSTTDGVSIRQLKTMLMTAMSSASARRAGSSEKRIGLNELDIAELKKEQDHAHDLRMRYII